MYRNSLGIDMLHILKSEIIIHMVKGAFFGEGYCCCMEEIIGRWGAAKIVGGVGGGGWIDVKNSKQFRMMSVT